MGAMNLTILTISYAGRASQGGELSDTAKAIIQDIKNSSDGDRFNWWCNAGVLILAVQKSQMKTESLFNMTHLGKIWPVAVFLPIGFANVPVNTIVS